MKRIIAILLTFSMLVSCFFALCTISASAESIGSDTAKLRESFSADLKGTKELETDGHLGVPVNISTFYRDSVTSNGVAILYVVGHNEKRIGTDSDEDIIEDMLADGYCVSVLDYMDNPLSVGNEFGWSVHKIFTGAFKSKAYDFGYVRKTHDAMYVVPSGCRIDREIFYYSLDEMALNGTNEYILWLWNTYYAGPDGIAKDENKNDLPYAETIYDMIKKDGSPIDFDLRMDVVYPSNPKETVPVYALASSAEERTMSLSSAVRPYFTTAVLQGYAGVIYDHEYIPMSRQDHYKYYGNYTLPYSSFTLGTTNANAVHSAAIRRIRYMAESYGYNGDYISAWGFSKSGPGPAILANTKHEEMGEILDFGEYVPEGKDPKGYQGEQPWLYYEGTNTPISSNITVAYSGSGAGICQYRERLMTEDSVPIVSSIGTADTTGNFYTYIPAAKEYLDSHPEIESDFLIPEGLGHNPAYGYDNVKQIEQFNEIWCWLDNHVRAAYRDEAPEVLWATPSSNKVFDALEEPVTVKFSRAMDVDSVKENLKVIRLSDGKAVEGEWEILHGSTTFKFTSSMIINASSYAITVGAETKAKDGVKMGVPFKKVFTISGDKLLTPVADTYVSSVSPDKNFGGEDLIKISNTVSEHNKGLISFENLQGFSNVTKALLLLDRKENKNGNALVYSVGSFDENTVTYNNAPEVGELLANVPVDSQVTTVDVTDYVKNTDGNTVSFALDTTEEKVFYEQSFDNIASTSQLIYDVDYRYGGGSATMTLSDDAKDGSKSIYVTNRQQNANRIKFLKSFGTDKLTSEHLGLTVKASFWIKTELDSMVSVGAYEHKALSGVHTEAFSVKPGEWNYVEYILTVDQAMIDGNNRAITVVPNKNGNYYLDAFKVEILSGGFGVVSKEYDGEEAKLSATLVLYTPEKSDITGTAATISSGEKADSVINGENYVEGVLKDNTADTVKGYIKFPISEFDTESDSITLKLNATSDGSAKFSVYGVLNDDTRFAENFTKGITWNTALANQIDGNGVDESKTVLIGSETVTGSKTVELDVKDYVKTMKNANYNAVTFIIVKENRSVRASNVTFENMDSYSAYVKSSAMNGYAVEVRKDPVNENNNVLFMEKCGTSENPSGYAQNIALTGLIQGDDTFDESDIGKTYKVSFKQYVTAPGATAGNYCNIGTVGSATSGTLLNGITKSVSSTSTNVWNTVEFTITVNENILGNKATALIIASGWAATGIYIDDIVVEEFSGDLYIEMDYTPGTTDFTGLTEYKNVGLVNPGVNYGVTKDPLDNTNDVFYFERSAYTHSASFKGLITQNDKFTAADVGKKYTVTFRQLNVNPGGNAGVLTTIDQVNSQQYFLNSKMTINRYIDGTLYNSEPGKYGLSVNEWHTVKFEIEVTEQMVGLGSAIVVSSNASTSTIYIDDIVVTVEGGKSADSISPVLSFEKAGVENKSKTSLIALINGGAKDNIAVVPNNTFELKKSSSGGESGIAKTYVSFNKTGYYHVIDGNFKFSVVNPIQGAVLKLYALDSDVSVDKLTWNNAYGNDTSTVGMKLSNVYGGTEIAAITLTDATEYTVNVREALVALEKNENVIFVLTADNEVKEQVVKDFGLEIASTVYAENEVKPVVEKLDGVLTVNSPYRIDYGIEKVEFFVNDKAIGNPTVNGQVARVNIESLEKGEYTAYAVVTYADGKKSISDSIEFSTQENTSELLYGDVNDDGKVDTTDLAMMKLHLATGSEINEANGDVDFDGIINTSDLANLKLFLAGVIKEFSPK
ncbi:MAG: DNRLRE domain-containing protein [Clostridia bacterium]|nr:DNRLRE domain-containing protein [Clostridia bacterium]